MNDKLAGVMIAVVVMTACTAEPRHEAPAPERAGTDRGDEIGIDAHDRWPSAARVFPARLDGKSFWVGAAGNSVWVATGDGETVARWSGKGEVQAVASGDLGSGPQLFVAWGRGRSDLDAPLSLEAWSPGKPAVELASWPSPRADFAHLSVADLDHDEVPELVYAAFDSKFFVREGSIDAQGIRRQGDRVRMAMSRAFGDLDGDGKTDRVLGRLYGEGTSPGDCTIQLATGQTLKVEGLEGGIRSLTIGQMVGDSTPTLYVADGWSSAYAKEGKARVRRVELKGKGAAMATTVGTSDDEYTFNVLEVRNGTLFAYGDRRITRFVHHSGEVNAQTVASQKTPLAPSARIARDASIALEPGSPARLLSL